MSEQHNGYILEYMNIIIMIKYVNLKIFQIEIIIMLQVNIKEDILN
jgi:hypothetical protein